MSFEFQVLSPGNPHQPAQVQAEGRLTLGPQLLRFSREMSELLEKRESPGLLLELSQITEIDSAGLGELVILYTTAEQHGKRLALLSPSPRLAQLLDSTRLSGILPHFLHAPEAVQWILKKA